MSTYTEEEAKTRWCPFARGALANVMSKSGDEQFEQLSISPGTGYNRVQRVEKDRKEASSHFPMSCACMASACMAWQQTDNKTWPSAPGEPEREPEPAGYCGLARRSA